MLDNKPRQGDGGVIKAVTKWARSDPKRVDMAADILRVLNISTSPNTSTAAPAAAGLQLAGQPGEHMGQAASQGHAVNAAPIAISMQDLNSTQLIQAGANLVQVPGTGMVALQLPQNFQIATAGGPGASGNMITILGSNLTLDASALGPGGLDLQQLLAGAGGTITLQGGGTAQVLQAAGLSVVVPAASGAPAQQGSGSQAVVQQQGLGLAVADPAPGRQEAEHKGGHGGSSRDLSSLVKHVSTSKAGVMRPEMTSPVSSAQRRVTDDESPAPELRQQLPGLTRQQPLAQRPRTLVPPQLPQQAQAGAKRQLENKEAGQDMSAAKRKVKQSPAAAATVAAAVAAARSRTEGGACGSSSAVGRAYDVSPSAPVAAAVSAGDGRSPMAAAALDVFGGERGCTEGGKAPVSSGATFRGDVLI